ncbi:hypothetical protein Ancab_026778 [Ancistrocladus abbreviatus]
MLTSTPLLQDVSTNLHSRRWLLHSPLYKPPSPVATSQPMAAQDPSELYAFGSGFDANVVMVVSVLLCALMCSLGLNSIIRCAIRCSSFVATEPNNNNHNTTSARVANKGIKKKALKTFPTVTYSPDLKLRGLDAECVICLSEFAAGERVRLLPKCNHGFHLRCIDKWLNSHSSCPTCRHCLIETCQKIVGCNQASTSQQQTPSPQETNITITPLAREDITQICAANVYFKIHHMDQTATFASNEMKAFYNKVIHLGKNFWSRRAWNPRYSPFLLLISPSSLTSPLSLKSQGEILEMSWNSRQIGVKWGLDL